MPNVTYQPSTDPDIEKRVRQRYEKKIAALGQLGFEPWFIGEELMPTFSFLSQFSIIPLVLKQRQIFRIRSPLRIALYEPVLRNQQNGTVVALGGFGPCFYTSFIDGSLLQTGHSLIENAQESDVFQFYPIPRGTSVAESLDLHRQKETALMASGKTVRPLTSIEDYRAIDQFSYEHLLDEAERQSLEGEQKKARLETVAFLCAPIWLVLSGFSDIKNPWLTLGNLLLWLVILGHAGLLLATEYSKRKTSAAFPYPEINKLDEALVYVGIAGLVLSFFMNWLKVLPAGDLLAFFTFYPWVVYMSCVSLYFHFKKWASKSI